VPADRLKGHDMKAQDRIENHSDLIDILKAAKLKPVWEKAELITEYQHDARFGTRWSMQKAMVCMWTDRPETTVHEMAFWISMIFDKESYGVKRAVIDLRKFKNMIFKCHHITESAAEVAVETAEPVETK